MTRKKVELKWIENASARRESLKNRRIGLVKKVSELSTLCGVSASLIIYGPNDQQPTTWPSPQIVQENLVNFYNMPKIKRSQKMMEQETYLQEKVNKVGEQLMKQQRKNKEMEFSHLIHIYQGNASDELTVNDLHSLISFTQEKREEIKRRLEYLQLGYISLNEPPTLGQATKPILDQMTPNIGHNTDGFVHDHSEKTPLDNIDGSNSWEQWFAEMMSNTNDIIGSYSTAKTDHMIDLNAPCQFYSYSGGNQIGLVDFKNYESYFGDRNQTDLVDYENFSSYISGPNRVQTIRGLQPHEGFNGLINTSGMPMLQSQPLSHIGCNNNGNDFTSRLQLHGMSTTLLPPNFEGKSTGNNIGVGLQPLGNNRTDGTGGASGSDMRLPSEFLRANTAANDIELPHDFTKQWHNNFHP